MRDEGFSLRAPIVVSLAMHALVAAAFFLVRGSAPVPQAPVYRVNLIAAPAGERAIGVVQPTPPPAPPVAKPEPVPIARATPVPDRMPAPPSKVKPAKVAKTATPNAAGAVAKK